MSGQTTDEAKVEMLKRFRGPLAERDREVVDHWRSASSAEHARAMIELAQFAEMMVAHTGRGKNPDEMFPGFPPLRNQTGAQGA